MITLKQEYRPNWPRTVVVLLSAQ